MNHSVSNPLHNLDQAIQTIRWNADGLIPAIAQAWDTKEVLMLAYMNEEALRRTLMEGQVVYYSRSRQALWRKGETSGHIQILKDIFFDCDQDAILLMVDQTGPACHENVYSCFHYQMGDLWIPSEKSPAKPNDHLGRILSDLAELIKSRNALRPEGAYTTYLFEKGLDKILKKVGEECAEVIIAAKNHSSEEIKYEVSDLLYHLLVLLEERKVDLDLIASELASRRK